MKKSAKATYKQLAKRVKKQPRLTTRVAQLELDLGKAKQARDRLRQYENTDPSNPTVYYLLGLAEHQLKDHEAALAAFETCLEHDPLYRRARVAYADLLGELGRTEQERKVRSEHYEMSAPSPDLDDAQKQMLLSSLRETVDPAIEWDDRWHPGDFTPNGTLARTVVRELEIGPEPVNLPPGAEPPTDDSKVTQMMARLPMGGITLKDVHAEVAELEEDHREEIPSEGFELEDETPDEYPTSDDATPDLEIETPPRPDDEAEPVEPDPEIAEPAPELSPDRDEELDPAPEAEEPPPVPEQEPVQAQTPETATAEPPAEATETPDFTELEHEQEVEPEHVTTELELALQVAEVEIDEFLDLQALLVELAEDEPPLVDMPVVDESVTRQAEEIDLERLQAEFAQQQSAQAEQDAQADAEAEQAASEPTPPEAEASPEKEDEPAPARPKKDPSERNVLSQDALNQLLQSFSDAESTGTGSADTERDATASAVPSDDEPDNAITSEGQGAPVDEDEPDPPTETTAEDTASGDLNEEAPESEAVEASVDADGDSASPIDDTPLDEAAQDADTDSDPVDSGVLSDDGLSEPETPPADEETADVASADEPPSSPEDDSAQAEMAAPATESTENADDGLDAGTTTDSVEQESEAEPFEDEDDQLNSFISEIAGESENDDDVLEDTTDSDSTSDDDLDELLTRLDAGDESTVGEEDAAGPISDTESPTDEPADTPSMDELVHRLEDLDRQEADAGEGTTSEPADDQPTPDSVDAAESTLPSDDPADVPQQPPASSAAPGTPEMSIPSGPPPRPRAERSQVDDELPPEEYRGPVSKTLVRLQIKQGKLDHARAMMPKLQRQHPDDPDVEALAAELQQAGS